MPKHIWRIEGIKSTTTVFRRDIPGHLSNDEVTRILQRLACKNLTENEIISASLRKRSRTALLEPVISSPPHGKRLTIWIGGLVDYIASAWREDGLPRKPEFSEDD